jgi:2-polyprenyl-3-methyl-5-hydroxy-6-metoxy-1,4-benzoquinol methylase
VFLLDRDGVTPERAYQLLRGFHRMSTIALEFVVLPKMLSPAGGRMIGAQQRSRKQRSFAPDMARQLVLSTLQRLNRKMADLRPDWKSSNSTWKSYEETRAHYSDDDLTKKKDFVRRSLEDCKTVLDLGCNAGEFSLLAAECGKTVVAADFDHPALGRLYARVRRSGALVNPVMLNIGRPTPAVGWQNREVASFLERSVGQFDCILVLGLVHHLLVTERATLPMLGDLLDRIDPKRVVLEWVDPKDSKFQQLAGLNQDLYSQLDPETLEESMGRKFRLLSKMRLPCGTRVMYLWSR